MVDRYLPLDFGKFKEDEIRLCLNIDSIFPDGFIVTSSCGNSADVLMSELNEKYDSVPRPMLDSMLDIAKTIHQMYNEARLKEKPEEPLEYPDWESLPQDLKYSNISQALDYVNKLSALGYHIGVDGQAVKAFSE